MIASLRRWWLTWRHVAVLAVLLVLSLAANTWQAYRALTAPLRAENEQLSRSLEQVKQIASGRNRDDAELLAKLDAIATRGQRIRIEYRTAAASAPLPEQCAPGKPRVDAVNRALGAQPESSP